MMLLRLLATAVMAMLATSAMASAPLCVTNKGLFTPCSKPEVARVRQRKAEVVAKKEKVAARQRQEELAHPERPRKPPRKALFAVGRLCRDSKGLSTPCPK